MRLFVKVLVLENSGTGGGGGGSGTPAAAALEKSLRIKWRNYMKKCKAEDRARERSELIKTFTSDKGNLYKKVKKYAGKKSGKSGISSVFINGDSGPTSTQPAIIKNAVKNHFKELSTPQIRDHFVQDFHEKTCSAVKNLPHTTNWDLDKPITIEEIAAARKNLVHGKAGGRDGLLPEMLKCGKEGTDEILQPLLQMWFDGVCVPDEHWCRADIVCLFKAGDPRGYGKLQGHFPVQCYA